MNFSDYDLYKLASPPEYEREPEEDESVASVGAPIRPGDNNAPGSAYATAMDGAPCPIPRGGPERTTVNAAEPAPATGQFEEGEEGPPAEPEQSAEEQQLPCPHARPSWRLCPWCLSINLPVDEDVSW